MEEAYEILDYLPIRFKEATEEEYIKFLWEAFESNYQNEKYQFSFMAYHMLFMSSVYFNVWQIKSIREDDFHKIRLGFNEDFGNATSPFNFSKENESRVLDLLRYTCASHSDVKSLIGQYKKLVKERNGVAHANGSIPFRTSSYLETRVSDIIRYTAEIQSYSKPIIQECFKKFLIESQDEETRPYVDISEQINEVLIHEHYLSQKDLEFCLEYDISNLADEPNYIEIEKIFQELQTQYSPEDLEV
ncbi:hypothetical protein [Salegentibacter mishustinae]|uniref:RiboL-PSP-HEPN domain-containing protein n=1 Tax=Salegentibacter mishustinae TaxID=270918 RepID=A0A0Q9Z5Y0_9FLAO|nr:hypothetical protein [Salegentibacter mishustinae]KRG28240.1 hypothetical protein APR42_05490 [Salegentibacter mishustinae]PNW22175.1 hypothetical protein APB85_13255 [Salegentibacter mishustinae]PZX67393.1 hypothetical protein LY54_00123 [Salegentibacter mishustinae]GGW80065.1 hypothetical protein GCM10008086_04820 [Salegentibacter mishustinae]